MTRYVLSIFLLLASTSVGLTGCAAEAPAEDGPGVSEDDITATPIAPGTFKLYSEPGKLPDPTCDRYTQLELSGTTATFHGVASEGCDAPVDATKKVYELSVKDIGCGSLVYSAADANYPIGRSIEITDHRARTCRDVVDGFIIVKESQVSFTGVMQSPTLYSYDADVKL